MKKYLMRFSKVRVECPTQKPLTPDCVLCVLCVCLYADVYTPDGIIVWQRCEHVKPHVNARNAYGKTNIHHQIQLQQFDQKTKVKTLLGWRADPNAEYGE